MFLSLSLVMKASKPLFFILLIASMLLLIGGCGETLGFGVGGDIVVEIDPDDACFGGSGCNDYSNSVTYNIGCTGIYILCLPIVTIIPPGQGGGPGGSSPGSPENPFGVIIPDSCESITNMGSSSIIALNTKGTIGSKMTCEDIESNKARLLVKPSDLKGYTKTGDTYTLSNFNIGDMIKFNPEQFSKIANKKINIISPDGTFEYASVGMISTISGGGEKLTLTFEDLQQPLTLSLKRTAGLSLSPSYTKISPTLLYLGLALILVVAIVLVARARKSKK